MVGRRAVVAAALLVAACRGDAGGVDRVEVAARLQSKACVDKYTLAATSRERYRVDVLTSLKPLGADGELASCTVCGGMTADDVTDQLVRDHADATLRACGVCSGTARDRFLAVFDQAEAPSNRPWRQLASDCPEMMGTTPATARFASAGWLWLTLLMRELPSSYAPIELPLPAWGMSGAGFALPSSTQATFDAARRHVTVGQTELYGGALPWARLTPGAPRVDVVRGADYPGPVRDAADLADALDLATAPAQPTALIAPRAMAARRLLTALDALDTVDPAVADVHLAGGESTRLEAPWLHPVRLTTRTTPGQRVLDLQGTLGLGTVDGHGTVGSRCARVGSAWSAGSLEGELARLATAGGTSVALGVPPTLTVQELMHALDAVTLAKIVDVSLVPAASGPLPPCPPTP